MYIISKKNKKKIMLKIILSNVLLFCFYNYFKIKIVKFRKVFGLCVTDYQALTNVLVKKLDKIFVI